MISISLTLPGPKQVPFTKYIYFREYRPDGSDPTADCTTLLVLGLGTNITNEDLHSLFGRVGAIQSIQMFETKSHEHFAHIKYYRASDLRKALKMRLDGEEISKSDKIKQEEGIVSESVVEGFGLQKWKKELVQSMVQPGPLKKKVDEYMKKFDTDRVKEKSDRIKDLRKPDADGFITVTDGPTVKIHHAHIPKPANPILDTDGWETVTKDTKQLEAIETNELGLAAKIFPNFYRFQRSEGRKKQLSDLKRKFEEDKDKIHKMKQSKKFKSS
eukprot:TRINITY_DN10922_c0_g1_i1.p1 TRINITY_DN10922_c0_g1~~TRINITY_DN10922_c0_g1_i1.p1  ORF type:complete len:298 (+),score=112.07 TRINITY_DN10922_c0_g1_i1:79-894(+)